MGNRHVIVNRDEEHIKNVVVTGIRRDDTPSDSDTLSEYRTRPHHWSVRSVLSVRLSGLFRSIPIRGNSNLKPGSLPWYPGLMD